MVLSAELITFYSLDVFQLYTVLLNVAAGMQTNARILFEDSIAVFCMQSFGEVGSKALIAGIGGFTTPGRRVLESHLRPSRSPSG